jgi:sortase A
LNTFRGSQRNWLSLLLIVGGLALLSYVGHEYWSMYAEQKRLAAEWERQKHQPVEAGAAVSDGLTRVSIPSLELDAIVVEGTSNKQLRLGPGRLLNSAQPGDNGNAVITAHRDTFFRHIHNLRQGDEILIRRNGEILKYSVTSKRVVKPTDMSVVKQTEDPQLTLITCYPPYYVGPAPERLAVKAKLAERSADPEFAPQAKAAGAQ